MRAFRAVMALAGICRAPDADAGCSGLLPDVWAGIEARATTAAPIALALSRGPGARGIGRWPQMERPGSGALEV